MPQSAAAPLEKNFTGGLKTEFTGLNFPENACTDTQNCVFSVIGDVARRPGIDFENNFLGFALTAAQAAKSSFVWTNAGGDGNTKLLVEQVGGTLYFYLQTAATIAAPLSTTKLASTVTLSTFLASGSAADPTISECQYAAGNGYLFVYHPNLDPFYCTYAAGAVTGNIITIQFRDFAGIPEAVADDFRPSVLTNEHAYNLQNQGWINGAAWTGNSTTTNNTNTGTHTWTIQTGLTISPGQIVSVVAVFSGGIITIQETGTVSSYVSGTGVITINITSTVQSGATTSVWTFASIVSSFVAGFKTAAGVYPSNSDVWWLYKNSSNAFDPATTLNTVTIGGPAPKGHYILNAFNQDRGNIGSLASITATTTTVRPRTGTWFQGRVWYTGVDASFAATGDAPFSTWSETIYFSQIIVKVDQFGKCFEMNDPTDEDSFELLPTDGGTIQIQGCGSIFKLYPILNGLIVLAANGIWFITGSQGIGFSATDYTIAKVSSIQGLSATSFIDVQGTPVFWNEEGIYAISPDQNGALAVNNLALGTILSFYAEIPLQSKKFARGDYHPLDYTIQWLFKGSNETDVNSRYQYDSVLTYNTTLKAFSYYTIGGTPHVHDIKYIVGPGGSTSPDPVFKYFTSYPVAGQNTFTFSEERDFTYVDFKSFDSVGTNFVSYFVTGYKLHGGALRQWQPVYVYMFYDQPFTSYKIQGLWNYAASGNSGKFSSIQVINAGDANFFKGYRRHKIRGHGVALQLKVISVDGQPFNLMGWAIYETINQSI